VRVPPPALLALAAALLGAGCSSRIEGPAPANLRPHVLITGGPPFRAEGPLLRDSYLAHISWRGWDDDGTIDRFEYAIDIDRAAVDTNAVTGNRDGDPWEEINDPRTPIAWTRVEGFDSTFVFTVAGSDSNAFGDIAPPGPGEPGSGIHAFYLRAVDDRGGVSDVDWLAYVAETIAPRTTITSPPASANGFTSEPDLDIEWKSVDPDGAPPDFAPVAFEYKLIPIASIFHSAALEIERDTGPWTRVGADTRRVSLRGLAPGTHHAFGVRAIDRAGAKEPFLEEPRNAVRFQVLEAGSPILEVREPTLGRSACGQQYGAPPESFEVLTGARLRFEMIVHERLPRGWTYEYRWLVTDVPEPCREDPDWRACPGSPTWTRSNVTVNFPVFSRPGTRHVYFQARSIQTPSEVSSCVIQLEYIELAPRGGILYVDDSYTAYAPADDGQDAFYRAVLDTAVATGITPTVDVFETYGPDDRALDATPPDLRTLARYRLLVWNTSGEGRAGTGISAWRRVTTGVGNAMERVLPRYLSAGGQLWVFGTHVAGATVETSPFVYPKTIAELGPGNFAHDFLHLRTSKIDVSRITSGAPWDAMVGATACPGSTGAGAGYPRLRVDPEANAGSIDAFGNVEAVLAPFDPSAPAGLDTLYCYDAYGPSTGIRNSRFQGKPCAFRYASRAAVPEQGKVAYFGFPLEHFHVQEVKALAAKLFAWFEL
jgi:hypothetical protein